jgi:hypothetical protein
MSTADAASMTKPEIFNMVLETLCKMRGNKVKVGRLISTAITEVDGEGKAFTSEEVEALIEEYKAKGLIFVHKKDPDCIGMRNHNASVIP